MGQLLDRIIIQSRQWIDPDPDPIPSSDYNFTYPVTVYDAVKQTMDDNSPSLSDELASIYRLIHSKQDIIEGGTPGNLMTWSGTRGYIGSMEVTKSINPEPSARSHSKIPTERAIGDSLDTKASSASLNNHINNTSVHLTDVERTRWNSMAPLSSLQAHISNLNLHITNDERIRWNSKADQVEVDDHIYNTNNPHNVTAHQVGSYSRTEVDAMFEDLRESFFNYMNVQWDERSNQASLVEYHPANWNPNYILGVDQELPDVPDPSLTYFAIKPATDYETNESNDVIIYVKRPGLVWQEVGFHYMNVGDMVIRFPDTAMYVWVQGRFLRLFTDSAGEDDFDNDLNGNVWRPTVDPETGELSWTLSDEETVPDPVIIKGKDGYTPQKGIDYVDGVDGKGVALGGLTGDLLVKLSEENYDTTWKSFSDLINDLIIAGWEFPEGIVSWESIKGRPEWYTEPGENDDGFITQHAVTKMYTQVRDIVNNLLEKIDDPITGIDGIRQSLFDHLADFNNPHRVKPDQIGAVTIAAFSDHVQNFDNPHHVTAEQIGLGNVDNTSDKDKPLSDAANEAIQEILDKIQEIQNGSIDIEYVSDVVWNEAGGELTFTFKDDSTLVVNIPCNDIINTIKNIYFDDITKDIVIVTPDDEETRINISSISLEGSTGKHINVRIEDGIVYADIIPASIGQDEIVLSVNLRGSPTTTTQPVGDKSTRIATTEFVKNQVLDNLISYEVDRPLSANMGRILNQQKASLEQVIEIINNYEGITVIDSLDSTNVAAALSANMGRYLDLTKAPRVHTSPDGATFGRATISLFGHARASNVDPLMDGTVFKGTDDGYFARGDHRHPTDISRAPIHSPEFTGEPRAPHPPDDSSDDRIATTQWIRKNVTAIYKGYCTTASNVPVKTVILKSSFLTSNIDTSELNILTRINILEEIIGSGLFPKVSTGNDLADAATRLDYLEEVVGTDSFPQIPNGTTEAGILLRIARLEDVVAKISKELNGDSDSDGGVYTRQIGSTISVTFSNTDTSGAAVTHLDVHGTGAAPVTYGGKAVIDNMISGNHTHLFVFDGTSWLLLNPAGIHPLPDNDNSNRFVSSEWVRRYAYSRSDVDAMVKAINEAILSLDDNTYDKNEINNFLDSINKAIDGKAPIYHASTSTMYGVGSATLFGHLKVNDSYTVSAGSAADGVAASSKAVYDLYVTLNNAIGSLRNDKAPIYHASTATTYGVGSTTLFGHLKINDSYATSAGAAANGVAASSKALNDAYNALNRAITNLNNGKAPVYHASSATTYGVGTTALFGHLKINDAYTSSAGAAANAVAASSAAVYNAYTALNNAKVNRSGDTITGNLTVTGTVRGGTVWGAVWNDYAEFRQSFTDVEPGRIVIEDPYNDDHVVLCNERMAATAMAVSDTFGFAIGQLDIEGEYSLPIGITGRVLVHTDKDRNTFKPGDVVCSGKDGTVSKMSRREIMMYPDRIIGVVSSVPNYETWGSGDVIVNDRIWIKVK